MLWTGCSFVEIDGFIKGNYCFGKNPNCLPEIFSPLSECRMAWRRKRARELLSRQLFDAQQEIVTGATILQIIEEEEDRPRRGSVIGREIVPRDRYNGYWRLMMDYFVDRPVYGEKFFRRRLVLFL